VFDFLKGAGGGLLLWFIRQATPMIFQSLVEVVAAWHESCKATPNKFDDVFSKMLLDVVMVLAESDEAREEPGEE